MKTRSKQTHTFEVGNITVTVETETKNKTN